MSGNIESKLEKVADKLGYESKDPKWLLEALMVAGSTPVMWRGQFRRHSEGNKRLAGIGHHLINMAIAEWAFDEGRSIALVRIFDLHGLGSYVSKNPSQRGEISASTKAINIEAIIGAIYKDGGMEPAKVAMVLFAFL
ncbi:hypothetical protein F5X68DRAFT_194548 [Plectosphaerella plurivora]|uniref:RNase III domain-containing protein n=1 Tax=Plectosphaerella plurivora TaxID=936078 RepID=A0A9P9A7B8_9PEZI|nr:hypothetical protein F5X68DRAFT_194548 [Plectosphaerella plurivora]